jgi:methylated-DNA-[protein]-cysteine S-methyltransferase
MGILGSGRKVVSIVIGRPSAASARTAARNSIKISESDREPLFSEADWHPQLRQQLQQYAQGERVEFGGFELALPEQTRFRDQVLAATRALRYGETVSYGELARRVGHPRAARAVGTVMSTNRFPIVIPCHRVLAAGGKIGGYSAPTGTDLKQKLLKLERAAFIADLWHLSAQVPSEMNMSRILFTLTAVAATLFVITILAMIAMLLGDPVAPVNEWFNRHGGTVFIVEVCAIGALGLSAMIVDRRETLRSQPKPAQGESAPAESNS